MIGLTGVDESAQILQRKLKQSNVIWNFIAVNTCSTIIKSRVMARNQQIIRLDFEENFNNFNTIELLNMIEIYLPKYKVLVLSDYAKGTLSHIEDMIKLARYVNIPVIIDPKGIDFSRYKGATLLTPNMSEFEAIVGVCRNEEILINRAKEVIVDYNLSALLLTRSEQGMTLFKINEDNPVYFPAHAKEVYDVTGAGDTVIGVLSAVLSSGANLEQACFLANLAAGIVISKTGAAAINITEMENVMCDCNQYMRIPFGILDEKTLKKAVSLLRKKGEKIVMTNGVFDILHAGHVNYLNCAKKFGDRLIVAVNSDDSTRRLKGKMRPINTLKNRMFVLSALSMVDWVVSFDEDTPKRLIKDLSPDFLVKGGDYQICDIDGSKEVRDSGGKVCTVNFQTGYSSSDIIDMLQSRENKHKKN